MVDKVVKELLSKGTINLVDQEKRRFLSRLFLVPKKGWRLKTCHKLPTFKFILYQHFKMKGLHCRKELFIKGYYKCKLDLKDAYFFIPLNKKFRKYFEFSGQTTCMSSYAFALSSASDFYKIDESPCVTPTLYKHKNDYCDIFMEKIRKKNFQKNLGFFNKMNEVINAHRGCN